MFLFFNLAALSGRIDRIHSHTGRISMENGKKLYTSPNLTIHGNVEEITQGFSVGEHLDATFTAGTPRGDLGFS